MWVHEPSGVSHEKDLLESADVKPPERPLPFRGCMCQPTRAVSLIWHQLTLNRKEKDDEQHL